MSTITARSVARRAGKDWRKQYRGYPILVSRIYERGKKDRVRVLHPTKGWRDYDLEHAMRLLPITEFETRVLRAAQ